MSEISFIHTADLHLDSPFVGLNYLPKSIFKRIQESTFTSFKKIVDAALSLKVDFVLICGDLFDGEDRSIKAQARLRKQLERLDDVGIEVFILYGNHDHLSGNWTTIDMPKNVHTFSSEVEMKDYTTRNGTKIHVYGFSYPERHVMIKKINDYKKIEGADFHIGMLHGQHEGGSKLHQPYAPFTITDLLEKGMDYWALGHIHKQHNLHRSSDDPLIIYPGNIQGRNRKEEGEKGCFAITLNEQETKAQFIETADIVWQAITISVENITAFSDLFLLCRNQIEKVRLTEQGILLFIQIEDAEEFNTEIYEKVRNGELLEALQDGEEYEEAFVWTYKVDINVREANSISLVDQAFKTELEHTVVEFYEENEFEQAINDLYAHIYANRYVERIPTSEKSEILREAEQIVSQLMKSNS